jgi:acetyl esterase/lipase
MASRIQTLFGSQNLLRRRFGIRAHPSQRGSLPTDNLGGKHLSGRGESRVFGAVVLVGLLGVSVAFPAHASERKVVVRKKTSSRKPVVVKPATGNSSSVSTNSTLASIVPTTLTSVASAVSLTTSKVPTTVAATSAPASTTGSGGPGTLIAANAISDAPAGMNGYKLRYKSVSSAGASIEVTGLAYIPKAKAPAGGWPVLSYAHGTVGLADRCTPSNNISAIENTVAGAFGALGFVVVASDYEGLSTPGRHPYIVGVSEGRGVLDIVRAARQIPGATVSNRFVTWGHSQGGHAALFAGELAPSWAPELKLLGVVAGAPPSQLSNVGDSVSTSPFRGYLFMVAAGLQAADPTLNFNDVLTTKAQELLPVMDTGCNSEIFAAFNSVPMDQLLIKDGLLRDPWKSALAANEPGKVKTNAPILIVHGDKDEQIPVATSAALKKKLCALGGSVERKIYPGQDHGGAALASLFEVAAWLSLRVAGVPATNGC